MKVHFAWSKRKRHSIIDQKTKVWLPLPQSLPATIDRVRGSAKIILEGLKMHQLTASFAAPLQVAS